MVQFCVYLLFILSCAGAATQDLGGDHSTGVIEDGSKLVEPLVLDTNDTDKSDLHTAYIYVFSLLVVFSFLIAASFCFISRVLSLSDSIRAPPYYS